MCVVTETRRRKAISTSKYCLFDIGLARHLQGRRGLAPGSAEHGSAFESYIFQEITPYCDYHRLDTPTYWRSKSRIEVDFVLEDLAVEVKARKNVTGRDLRGLQALREEGLFAHDLLVSMEPMAREVDSIRMLPWTDFLEGLWRGEWFAIGSASQ